MIGKLQLPLAGNTLVPPRFKPIWVIGALLIVLAILAGLAVSRAHSSAGYVTQPVVQQDLTQTITASGTVNPQNTITVGTQVSGTIQSIYVDYNSKVKKGEILARLDTSQMQAQLSQAQAALAQAEAQANAQSANASSAQSGITIAGANNAAQQANAKAASAAIATADANVSKSQSALDLANQTLERDKTLLSHGYISQSQYDTDKSNAVAAQSALQSAQAAAVQSRAQAAASASQSQASAAQSTQSISQAASSQATAQAAQAAVDAAQALVQQDEDMLNKAVIRSPVDGTVVSRAVSVGQTVAASLQTPTLFSIAQDLKKMEVDISVGEPDIGDVRPGDSVSFSVLAYPNQTFNGTVKQVRINPTTVNNVVTYTVITLVDNSSGKLLPGMTANATISVATAKNALVVPTSALAWRPSSTSGTHRRWSTTGSATNASPWGQTAAGVANTATAGGKGVIFVQRNGKTQPVPVTVGLISGTQAAVAPLRGTLQAGDNVIIGDSSQKSTTSRAQRTSGPGMNAGPSAGGIGRALR
jgi:HlyD family secretion protein